MNTGGNGSRQSSRNKTVFTLRHRATLGFMVNLLNFIKHLFRDGEMNFLINISETKQCYPEFVLD